MIDRDATKLYSESAEESDATFHKLIASLEASPRWDCASCQGPQRGPDPGGKICIPCQEKKKQEAWRQLPRQEILTRAKVPDKFRSAPPWKPDDWPRDPRAEDLCPATWWPPRAVELIGDRTTAGARSLTMRGCNGAGKSHRAADLIVRLHRTGAWPAFWVTEKDLVFETENATAWSVQPLRNAALNTTVLVVDDVLSTEGNRGRVKDALGIIFELVQHRADSMSLITIYTTHRSVGPGKDAAGKSKDNPDCVKALHPGIYSRLREGMVINCGDEVDHRGRWAR